MSDDRAITALGGNPAVTGDSASAGDGADRGSRWDGAEYERVNGLQRWVAARSLAATELAGDERLLDVGCGDGYVTAELAGRLPRGTALGIDPSPKMIEVAVTRIAGTAGNLAFQAGAVQTMTFDGDFEVVVSFNALHWVADHALALHRIRRALATPGSALLQMVCAGTRQSVEQTAMSVCRKSSWQQWFDGFVPPFHHADPDVFAGQARQAGFTVTNLTVDDLVWDFGTPSDFLAWARVGFSDWMARLPDESARAAFIAEVGDAYAEVAGSAQLFRFLQMTARLRAA